MSRVSAVFLRTVAAAMLALPLAAATGAPASATHAVVTTPFFADHTRYCADSYTEGSIGWNPAHWGETQRVDVAGVLVDRAAAPCDTRRPGYAYADFTAYVDGAPVDAETVSLETAIGNSVVARREFRFSLFNTTNLPDVPIDQVDVQVCRTFGPMLPAFSCGEVQSYRPPQIGPAD